MEPVKTREPDFNYLSHHKSHCLLRVDFDDSYGPHFFEDPDTGSAVNVTKEWYVDIPNEAFPENSEDNQRSIFIQGGGPAHASRSVLNRLEITFPDRLISNKSDFMWPPR